MLFFVSYLLPLINGVAQAVHRAQDLIALKVLSVFLLLANYSIFHNEINEIFKTNIF